MKPTEEKKNKTGFYVCANIWGLEKSKCCPAFSTAIFWIWGTSWQILHTCLQWVEPCLKCLRTKHLLKGLIVYCQILSPKIVRFCLFSRDTAATCGQRRLLQSINDSRELLPWFQMAEIWQYICLPVPADQSGCKQPWEKSQQGASQNVELVL